MPTIARLRDTFGIVVRGFAEKAATQYARLFSVRMSSRRRWYFRLVAGVRRCRVVFGPQWHQRIGRFQAFRRRQQTALAFVASKLAKIRV
jgi:hypothetical protein